MFTTIVNNSNGIITLTLVLFDQLGMMTTSFMDIADIQQVNQLKNLVWDIQSHMYQHYREAGLCPYPLRIFVSLTKSLTQMTAHHYVRYHHCLFFSSMPTLSPVERYYYGNQANFHLQTAIDCDHLAIDTQTCLDFAKQHGVGEVLRYIA